MTDKIKKRVQGLLNVAHHPSTDEHEADNALTLAQKLIKKYDLDMGVIEEHHITYKNKAESDLLKEIIWSIIGRDKDIYTITGRSRRFAFWSTQEQFTTIENRFRYIRYHVKVLELASYYKLSREAQLPYIRPKTEQEHYAYKISLSIKLRLEHLPPLY